MRTLLIAAATFSTLMFAPGECSAKDAATQNEAEISGSVRNIAVNKTATVKMQVKRDDSGGWRAKGEFDNTRLFGRFDVPGRTLLVGDDYVSVQFKGEIEFGPDGGWEPGTKAPYVMTVCLRNKDADGVYDIGDLPNHYDYHQYGTLKLTSSKGLLNAEIKSKKNSSK